ncbi:MAG: hypothetical protein Ct9H300mP13_5460 [Gammaproteobacteria bacterium]|nr:MAG: hypothetical protein Ct9H300mP13_5460 [Gammaproteobacteria bacterium]
MDSVETAIAWQAAIERRDGPTTLLCRAGGLLFRRAVPSSWLTYGEVVMYCMMARPNRRHHYCNRIRGILGNGSSEKPGGHGHSVVCFASFADIFDHKKPLIATRFTPAVTVRVAVEAGVVADGFVMWALTARSSGWNLRRISTGQDGF